MRYRASAAIAILAVVTAAAGAEAAVKKPKPVCDLIKDAAGDSGFAVVGPKEAPDSSSDILSADIASNAKTLTAVIRLKALSNPDPESPLSQAFYLDFNVPRNDTQYFLTARLYPTGNHFFFGYEGVDPTTGIHTSYASVAAAGVVDTAKSEIHVSVPLAQIKSYVKLPAGTKLIGLEATSWHGFGQGIVPSQQVGPVRAPVGGLFEQWDDAVSNASYTMGAPSCVKVGA